MEGLGQLIIFSFVMMVGSYGAGSAPLFMPLNEEKLHMISVLGAGLLVGVAFAVIIPEGVLALIKAYTLKSHHSIHQRASIEAVEGNEVGKILVGRQLNDDHSHEKDEVSFEGLDRMMGISLVLGFIFMMFVEQLADYMSGNSNNRVIATDAESLVQSSGHNRKRGGNGPVNWTTTLGLVVHAAADGIALGAAAATNELDVEIIIFLAIMLHKAPAAFGLVTFLLHEGLDRNRARKHLLIFSVSAPMLALITFICLSSGSEAIDGKFDTMQATGLAMLFSAGTFLYVATMHVLPEVTNMGSGGHSHGFSKTELFLLTLGALLPLLMTLGHHH